MAASSQPDIVAARKQERLAFLTTPWFDKVVAASQHKSMVLATSVCGDILGCADFWGNAARASDSLPILSVALVIWARLSLGRSIGLVPALRTLVTHGAYRYVRHPIYSAISLSIIAAALNAYSPWNLAIFGLGIFWFALKSVVEESFLRSDPGYADYMQHVRWRWLPGIAWALRLENQQKRSRDRWRGNRTQRTQKSSPLCSTSSPSRPRPQCVARGLAHKSNLPSGIVGRNLR